MPVMTVLALTRFATSTPDRSLSPNGSGVESQRENVTLYIPLTTMLLLSVAATIVLRLVQSWRR